MSSRTKGKGKSKGKLPSTPAKTTATREYHESTPPLIGDPSESPHMSSASESGSPPRSKRAISTTSAKSKVSNKGKYTTVTKSANSFGVESFGSDEDPTERGKEKGSKTKPKSPTDALLEGDLEDTMAKSDVDRMARAEGVSDEERVRRIDEVERQREAREREKEKKPEDSDEE